MSTFTIIVIVLAVCLMVAELVLPGGLAFCAGLGLVLVAACYELEWEQGYFNLAFIWCMSTLLMSFVSAFILNRFMSGETCQDIVDEDDGMIGGHAKVVETVTKETGRVLFRGTSWKAVSAKGQLDVGEDVMIMALDNQTLVVEESEENQYNKLKSEI